MQRLLNNILNNTRRTDTRISRSGDELHGRTSVTTANQMRGLMIIWSDKPGKVVGPTLAWVWRMGGQVLKCEFEERRCEVPILIEIAGDMTALRERESRCHSVAQMGDAYGEWHWLAEGAEPHGWCERLWVQSSPNDFPPLLEALVDLWGRHGFQLTSSRSRRKTLDLPANPVVYCCSIILSHEIEAYDRKAWQRAVQDLMDQHRAIHVLDIVSSQ